MKPKNDAAIAAHRAYQRAYMRGWRARNRGRVVEANRKYWVKKAAEAAKEEKHEPKED